MPSRTFGQTMRVDAWWTQPLLIFLGLLIFIVYSTWAAMQGEHYRFGPYLSPFYSPELFGDPVQSWFGLKPAWIPAWALQQATEELYDVDDPEVISQRAAQIVRGAREREDERHDEYDDPDQGGEA